MFILKIVKCLALISSHGTSPMSAKHCDVWRFAIFIETHLQFKFVENGVSFQNWYLLQLVRIDFPENTKI